MIINIKIMFENFYKIYLQFKYFNLNLISLSVYLALNSSPIKTFWIYDLSNMNAKWILNEYGNIFI